MLILPIFFSLWLLNDVFLIYLIVTIQVLSSTYLYCGLFDPFRLSHLEAHDPVKEQALRPHPLVDASS
jgi:hypothetical protein